MKKNNSQALCIMGLLAFFLVAVSPVASAAIAFSDNFEDGDHAGWLLSTTGGSGSTSVNLFNGSQMAFVGHTGNGSHALSHDFIYTPDQMLSFDMQVIATTSAVGLGSTSILHSKSGVTLSFLNVLNNSLGKISVVNATNPSTLGASENLVDGLLHNYSGLLSEFASLAGLDNTAPITKFSLSFWATGSTSTLGTASSSNVRFDNLNVSSVPVPAAVWLFSSGLLGLTAVARRKKA